MIPNCYNKAITPPTPSKQSRRSEGSRSRVPRLHFRPQPGASQSSRWDRASAEPPQLPGAGRQRVRTGKADAGSPAAASTEGPGRDQAAPGPLPRRRPAAQWGAGRPPTPPRPAPGPAPATRPRRAPLPGPRVAAAPGRDRPSRAPAEQW